MIKSNNSIIDDLDNVEVNILVNALENKDVNLIALDSEKSSGKTSIIYSALKKLDIDTKSKRTQKKVVINTYTLVSFNENAESKLRNTVKKQILVDLIKVSVKKKYKVLIGDFNYFEKKSLLISLLLVYIFITTRFILGLFNKSALEFFSKDMFNLEILFFLILYVVCICIVIKYIFFIPSIFLFNFEEIKYLKNSTIMDNNSRYNVLLEKLLDGHDENDPLFIIIEDLERIENDKVSEIYSMLFILSELKKLNGIKIIVPIDLKNLCLENLEINSEKFNEEYFNHSKIFDVIINPNSPYSGNNKLYNFKTFLENRNCQFNINFLIILAKEINDYRTLTLIFNDYIYLKLILDRHRCYINSEEQIFLCSFLKINKLNDYNELIKIVSKNHGKKLDEIIKEYENEEICKFLSGFLDYKWFGDSYSNLTIILNHHVNLSDEDTKFINKVKCNNINLHEIIEYKSNDEETFKHIVQTMVEESKILSYNRLILEAGTFRDEIDSEIYLDLFKYCDNPDSYEFFNKINDIKNNHYICYLMVLSCIYNCDNYVEELDSKFSEDEINSLISFMVEDVINNKYEYFDPDFFKYILNSSNNFKFSITSVFNDENLENEKMSNLLNENFEKIISFEKCLVLKDNNYKFCEVFCKLYFPWNVYSISFKSSIEIIKKLMCDTSMYIIDFLNFNDNYYPHINYIIELYNYSEIDDIGKFEILFLEFFSKHPELELSNLELNLNKALIVYELQGKKSKYSLFEEDYDDYKEAIYLVNSNCMNDTKDNALFYMKSLEELHKNNNKIVCDILLNNIIYLDRHGIQININIFEVDINYKDNEHIELYFKNLSSNDSDIIINDYIKRLDLYFSINLVDFIYYEYVDFSLDLNYIIEKKLMIYDENNTNIIQKDEKMFNLLENELPQNWPFYNENFTKYFNMICNELKHRNSLKKINNLTFIKLSILKGVSKVKLVSLFNSFYISDSTIFKLNINISYSNNKFYIIYAIYDKKARNYLLDLNDKGIIKLENENAKTNFEYTVIKNISMNESNEMEESE